MPVRKCAIAVGLLCGVLGSFLSADEAVAIPGCSYDAATRTVAITLNLPPGEAATVARNGNAIGLNGSPCGSSTVGNTIGIDVTGTTGADILTIDLGGGPFIVPTTSADIRFSVDLGPDADELAITGSAGTDDIRVGSSGIDLDAGAATGADVTFTNVETFVVSAGGGDDVVSGAGGAGTGAASPRPIRIDGGAGNDALTGGAGRDTADYSGAPGAVTADLATGTVADGSGATDTLAGIENLIGSSWGGTLIGDANANLLVGSASSQKLHGAGGNDTLQGPGEVDGGAGTDTYRCFGSQQVSVDLSAGMAAGCGSALLTNIENASATTSCDEDVGCAVDLVGTASPNLLQIVGYCNCVASLSGGGGGDTLRGGDGTYLGDVLHGGPGDDTLYGRGGSDTLFGGLGADHLLGGRGTDRLRGESGNDRLDGGVGSDACSGGPGIDVLRRCE